MLLLGIFCSLYWTAVQLSRPSCCDKATAKISTASRRLLSMAALPEDLTGLAAADTATTTATAAASGQAAAAAAAASSAPASAAAGGPWGQGGGAGPSSATPSATPVAGGGDGSDAREQEQELQHYSLRQQGTEQEVQGTRAALTRRLLLL